MQVYRLLICREPAVIPEECEFHPLIEDRFAIVCRSTHPLAHQRQVRWTDLERALWLALPAGLGVRTKFDALTERHFKVAPTTFPIVTQSLPVNMRLVGEFDVLVILPLNLVRPQLESGSLVGSQSEGKMLMNPIGMLQPKLQSSEAALQLVEFFGAFGR